MSLGSKRELLEVVRPRYLKASKVEEQKMLDEFTSAAGYHRKDAIRVPKNQVQVQNPLKRKTKNYRTIHGGEVVQALEQIREIYGHICSKRLQPFLPEAIRVLERCKEIELSTETKDLLSLAPPATIVPEAKQSGRAGVKISSASIDRCLRPIRIRSPHGLSTTKPGRLLKKSIAVCDAIHLMRQRLPFPLLGIDSDNGGEFTLVPGASAGVNDLLHRYCMEEKITFTRSRPYKKNDQAHFAFEIGGPHPRPLCCRRGDSLRLKREH